MYTQGTDFTTTGASTANYTTSQYQYQYQYQLPTTQTTTTTTQQYTTTSPVEFTTSAFTTQPTSYTQSFTTQPVSYTQSFTTQPDYAQSYTTTQQTTYTTGIPGFSTGVALKPTPVFKLLRQGAGISPTEQQGIVSTAMAVYQQGIVPISNNTASRIKKTIGGDWIVIVYPQGKPIDFNMTCVQGNDYMYFTLDNTAYQVCRLR